MVTTKKQPKTGKVVKVPRPAPKTEWGKPLGGNYVGPQGAYVGPQGAHVESQGAYVDVEGNYVGPQGAYVDAQGNYTGSQGYTDSQGNYVGPQGAYVIPLGGNYVGGLGYHPDLPDHRDEEWEHTDSFTNDAAESDNARFRGLKKRLRDATPANWNIGDNPLHPLPSIEDQGQTNSCTAQAAAGMMAYLYRWATGEHMNFSRLFIYYNSRKLLGWTGDSGAYIRTTLKSMRLFGAAPEKEWPFDPANLEAEPRPYHYSFAENFKTMRYARLDIFGDSYEAILDKLRRTLFLGFPVEFGFPVYNSIRHLDKWVIPVPSKGDQLLGGHAVLAVGYNNDIAYTDDQGKSQKGAVIIRNSWGAAWGDKGYAFLPYWYLQQGLAADLWTAYDRRWLNVDEFK